MTRYLAYDLEIARVIPDGETNWQAHIPLGISCAATAEMENGKIKTRTWHGIPQMTKEQCCEMVNDLVVAVNDGYTLLTHNGTSFDWQVVYQESGMYAECADLALHSVDTCLLVHCLKGFPVGLDAIARGMGIPGKIEGMSGAKAPQLWAEGQYTTVLEYVQQDARSTLEVALAIEQRKGLAWIAKSGRRNSLPIERLLTVFEAMQLPEPDTAWMTEPMPRSRFTGWMERQTA